MKKQELIGHLNWVRDNYSNEGSFTSGVRIGLGMAITEIEKLDEPEKPPKPVIPKIVAEQLEYWKRNKMNILWQFFLREIPSSTLSWLESDAGNYDKLIDAEKNGYEVEEEKLYHIKFSENQYAQRFDESKIDSILVNDKVFAGRFTEEQIKKMNPNFMALAVEVAECTIGN